MATILQAWPVAAVATYVGISATLCHVFRYRGEG
jgi:hypothetical protein